MGALIDTLSVWVWAAAGVCAVVAGIYGGIKWAQATKRHWREHRQEDFRVAVTQIGMALLVPVTTDLGHIHDCIERRAQEAKAVMEAHIAVMDAHIANDTEEFEELRQWRTQADVALRNIQQGQT